MGKVPVQPVKTAFLRVWLRVAYPGGARAPCPARLCVPPGPRFTERTRGEEAGRRGGVPQTAGTCRALLTRREALGPGGQVAGVAPRSKEAARALRPGVRWCQDRWGIRVRRARAVARA